MVVYVGKTKLSFYGNPLRDGSYIYQYPFPLSTSYHGVIMNSKEIIANLYNQFLNGNVPAILEALSDDVEWTTNGPSDIPFAGTRRGKQKFMNFFMQVGETTEFVKFLPKTIIGENDVVVALGETEGFSKSTGKKSMNEWAHAWYFKGGKVVKHYNYLDSAELAASLRELELPLGSMCGNSKQHIEV